MKQFYPVIHVRNSYQTEVNACMAKEEGADGVFLVDHYGEVHSSLVEHIVKNYQDATFKVGVNYLGHHVDNVLHLHKASELGCKMFWVDNSGTDEDNLDKLDEFIKADIEIYGGVHFKYQPKSKYTIEESIQRATPYIDYITLSGAKTGKAADIDFIKRAFEASKILRLAIASGITLKNVDDYLPFIDAFLVATSIIHTNDNFDKKKLIKLCQKIKNYS